MTFGDLQTGDLGTQQMVVGWIASAFQLLSFATLLLAVRRWRRGAFAAWTPRKPAPWGVFAMAPALFFVFLTIAASVAPELGSPQAEFSEEKFVANALFQSTVWLMMVAFFYVTVRRGGAAWGDMGLPTSTTQAWADIKLGTVTWLALAGPLFLIHLIVSELLQIPYKHQAFDAIAEGMSPAVLMAVALAAVITAPLAEEVIFRQMLQGSLERLEWLWLLARETVSRTDEAGPSVAEVEQAASQALQRPIESHPQQATFGGLRFGLPSIFASSTLFALVHLGHGAAPAPLFFFALGLGWLYFQTNRILPSVAAHMANNAFAVLISVLSR